MILRFVLVLSASILSFGSARAVVYSVGADGSCTHTTIPAALAAAESHPGPDVIHIAYNQSYTAQAIPRFRGLRRRAVHPPARTGTLPPQRLGARWRFRRDARRHVAAMGTAARRR